MIKFAALTPSLAQPGGAERTILIKLRYSDPARMQCTGVGISGYGGLDDGLCNEILKHTTIHGDVPKGRWQRTGSLKVKTDYNNLNDAVTHICRDADVLITWGSLAMGAHTSGLELPIICVSHCSLASSVRITGITHFVAVSKAACAYFDTAPGSQGKPVEIIPNGIEIDRVCPSRGRAWQREQWGVSASDKVLLYLGRQQADKNPTAAIKVLTELPSDYKLIMVGNQANSPYEPMPVVIETIERLGLKDRVKCLPPTALVGDTLAGADCLLHLSIREADSLVVKEAFMVGLPVVHTRVGSIPEMEAEFGPVGWGINFRPGDLGPDSIDPVDVADQIKVALCAGEKPRVTKMRAIAWERWTGAAMCARWADYLDKVVAGWTYPPGWGPAARRACPVQRSATRPDEPDACKSAGPEPAAQHCLPTHGHYEGEVPARRDRLPE